MINKIKLALVLGLTCFYSNANAWFFFFLPPSVTRGVSDSITGAKGNICVNEKTKVGDVITSLAGNTAKILSVSGTSSMCSNPALTIRADIEYTFTFKSNAGVNLSDDYEAKPLTDLQRYNGTLLIAASKTTRNKGVVINAREKKATSDPQSLADSVEKVQLSTLAEGVSKNAEQLKINGSNAWRFEVHGKTKGVFGSEVVFIITILEGDTELLIVNAYTQKANYEKDKEELRKLSDDITGITKSQSSTQSNTQSEKPQLSDILTSPEKPSNENTSKSVNIGSKLRELSNLLSDGLITKDDYELKKSELLNGVDPVTQYHRQF